MPTPAEWGKLVVACLLLCVCVCAGTVGGCYAGALVAPTLDYGILIRAAMGGLLGLVAGVAGAGFLIRMMFRGRE